MAIWNSMLPSRRNERSLTLSPFNDFDDMFDRFRNEFFSPELFRAGEENFIPKVEVKETDKNVLVLAELPGMSEKDISITLRENNLILEGEKRSEKKKEEKGYFRSEFSYGSFYRSIPLRADVDQDNVHATYKDGVLEVKLNKLEDSEQKTRKIEIKH